MNESGSEINLLPPHRRPRDPDEAKGTLVAALVAGAVLYLIGFVILVLARPSLHDGGPWSTGWLLAGGLLTFTGGTLFLLGVIGFGVKIGREAARV